MKFFLITSHICVNLVKKRLIKRMNKVYTDDKVEEPLSVNTCKEQLFTDENKKDLPPFNCHMSRFNIPIQESEEIHVQLLKQLIGHKGKYFIHLTNNEKLRYLWYDKDSKCIDVWGQESRIPKCLKKIELRIYKILTKMYSEGHELKPETIKWMEHYTQNFKKF